MAKRTINLGTSANKGDGDPLRTAFTKINDNFTEVYGLLGADEVDTDDVIAPMLVHNNHTNVTVTRDDDADQIIFTVDQAVTDLQGSVFGDDSTVLVDGVNSSINLDGTVKGNIVPDADEAYDIGSMTHKFRDLYLSGSTINLGGIEITNDNGVVTFGGNKVVVEGGTGDVQGSVFGDDSTLLVDAVNSVIPKAVVEDSTNWDTAYSWGDHSAAGYLVQADILDGTLTIDVNNTGDLVGSVFADDSTLLVDGVNGKIVGDIQNNLIETNNITALPGDTDLYIQGGIDSGTPGNPARVNIGTTNTSTIVLGAGDAVIYVNGNASSEVAAGTGRFDTITGDITGSVFGDDSTLLVDGVNGVIPTANLSGTVFNDVQNSTTTSNNIEVWNDIKFGAQLGDDRPKIALAGVQENDLTIISGYDAVNDESGDVVINADDQGSLPSYVRLASSSGGLVLSRIGGSTDIYGEVEFNDGTTAFQSGQTLSVNTNNFYAREVHGPVDGSLYLGGRTESAKTNNLAMTASITYAQTNFQISNNSTLSFGAGSGIDFTNATVTGLNIAGDVTGSVFSDDSTLLVDGVNGTIPAANLTGALPAIDGSALTGLPTALSDFTNDLDYAPIVGGAIQANGLPSGTTFTDTLTLPVLTAEPSSPVNGMVAVADGTSWDPMLNAAQTMVVYLAGAWRQIAQGGV